MLTGWPGINREAARPEPHKAKPAWEGGSAYSVHSIPEDRTRNPILRECAAFCKTCFLPRAESVRGKAASGRVLLHL